MKRANENTSTTQKKNVSTNFLKFFTWLGIWLHHVTKLLSDECANKVITHVLLTFTGQTSTGWLGCELHCINRESFMDIERISWTISFNYEVLICDVGWTPNRETFEKLPRMQGILCLLQFSTYQRLPKYQRSRYLQDSVNANSSNYISLILIYTMFLYTPCFYIHRVVIFRTNWRT